MEITLSKTNVHIELLSWGYIIRPWFLYAKTMSCVQSQTLCDLHDSIVRPLVTNNR